MDDLRGGVAKKDEISVLRCINFYGLVFFKVVRNCALGSILNCHGVKHFLWDFSVAREMTKCAQIMF